MEQHDLEQVFVNESGHFFMSENPALLSVGGNKHKVQKLTKDYAKSQQKQETAKSQSNERTAKPQTKEKSKKESSGEASGEAQTGTPGEVVNEDAKPETAPASESSQATLFDSVKTDAKAAAGNPESPEERGEEVVKTAKATSTKKTSTSSKKATATTTTQEA